MQGYIITEQYVFLCFRGFICKITTAIKGSAMGTNNTVVWSVLHGRKEGSEKGEGNNWNF